MSNIFISYNRQSEAIVKALAEDVEALGHVVWFDQDLRGGQAWWDHILATIRDCDVFVFALDPSALRSTACKREYGYATALGKPILPILVAEGVSTSLLPPSLSQIHFVDYRKQDRSAVLSLARSIGTVPPRKPLPDPLPPPPEVPIPYIGRLAEQIEATPALTYERQTSLVVDLKRSLGDQEFRQDALALLGRLGKRRDIFASIADEIDDILEKTLESRSPTPLATITLTSVIVVLLRDIVNLVVWVPISAALMWSLIWLSVSEIPPSHSAPMWLTQWAPTWLIEFIGAISPPLNSWDMESPKLFSFGVLLAAAIFLFACYVLAFALYISHRPETSEAPWIRLPFCIIGALFLLASVPFLAGEFHGSLIGSSLCVIGLASRLVVFMRAMQQPQGEAEQQANWAIPSSWIAWFGTAFVICGGLLLSYGFGWWAYQGAPLLGAPPFWVLSGALIVAIVIGRRVEGWRRLLVPP